MKKSRCNEEQIIGMIKEQDGGVPTAEVCREHRISTVSFYKYKSKFGGLDVSDSRKLKALEDEKEAARRTDAGASLVRNWFEHNDQHDVEGCLLSKVVTPVEKRKAVRHLYKELGVSQRRA